MEAENEPTSVVEPPPAKKSKKKNKNTEIAITDESVVPLSSDKKKKKKKKSVEGQSDNVQKTAENDAVNSSEDLPIKKKKKKKQKEPKNDTSSDTLESNETKEIVDTPNKKKKHKNEEPVIKKEKKKKKKGETSEKLFDDEDWNAESATITSSPSLPNAVFLKKAKSAEKVKDDVGPINLLDKKRRISFALSQNKFQDFDGIDRSMQDSPDIPYVPEKRPKQGVLKSKSANSTPNSVPTTKAALSYNTMMNGKSKAAKRLGLNSSRLMFNF